MSIRTTPVTSSSYDRQPTARRALAGVLPALALLSLVAPASATAADDKAWIEYRQSVMSGLGSHMGGIGDILKNGLPLTASIEHHASALAESARLIAPAFQQRVVEGKTDAKAEIWDQPKKFQKHIDDMQKEAEALAATVRDGRMDELGARVKALGQACGGCHKSFRKPKEESYKNQ